MEIIGGQALLEGVAFRSVRWRVAVRRCENGDIAIAVGDMARRRLLAMPFARGFVNWFVESPTELQWAATALEEAAERPSPPSEYHDYRGASPVRVRNKLPPLQSRRPSRVIFALVMVCAIPQVATDLIMRMLGFATPPWTPQFGAAMFAFIIAIMVIYFLLVVRFPDIRKTFQYNAAFRKTLWFARAGGEPSVAALRRHPSWHYQSTLVAFVLVAAALTFLPAAIFAWIPPVQGAWVVRHGVVLGVRLVLLPIVVIAVDELLRALGRHGHGGIMRALFAPLALFDGLVARAPTDDELAVAVIALRELRRLHEEEATAAIAR